MGGCDPGCPCSMLCNWLMRCMIASYSVRRFCAWAIRAARFWRFSMSCSSKWNLSLFKLTLSQTCSVEDVVPVLAVSVKTSMSSMDVVTNCGGGGGNAMVSESNIKMNHTRATHARHAMCGDKPYIYIYINISEAYSLDAPCSVA